MNVRCSDMQWEDIWREACGIWPRWSPTPEEAKVWREMLGRYSPDVLRWSMRAVVETYSSEHPKVAWMAKFCRQRAREGEPAEPRVPTDMTEVIDAPSRDEMVRDVGDFGLQRVKIIAAYTAVQNPHLVREEDIGPTPSEWPTWLLAKVWAKVRLAQDRDVPMALVPEREPGPVRPMREWAEQDERAGRPRPSPRGLLPEALRDEFMRPSGSFRKGRRG